MLSPRFRRLATLPSVVLALLAVACSSSSSSSGPCSGAPATACFGQCAAQAKATGCDGMAVTDSQCQQLCCNEIQTLSSACLAKAQTAWSCGAGATWSCSSGGNVPQADSCNDEMVAFAMCVVPADGG
jgi:hypothetical protein